MMFKISKLLIFTLLTVGCFMIDVSTAFAQTKSKNSKIKKSKKKVTSKSSNKKTVKSLDEDDYYSLRLENVQAEMDGFLVELNNNPSASGCIVNFGNSKQIKERERVVRYRLRVTKFDPARISIINGGENPKAETKFIVVQPGQSISEVCN